ncbi:MFS transporter [Streptomyces sp. MNU103]|uniref:MFS transporter n=1 Tax=Streptomyces sp. MNU103 TaxID=2560024 RepID=UPI001E3EB551|nr:hypothetical protein [Streptomyces sp. MNU103]
MTLTPTRAVDVRVRRLTTTLYGYSFLEEFVLLYPVYALLFSDAGLSVWQISSLFALWSVTAVVLEVPSGAWADAVSRRLLLVIGPLLTGAGFALWVLVPSYAAFAAGFVLWGTGGALCSGALEALVYDELERAGLRPVRARGLADLIETGPDGSRLVPGVAAVWGRWTSTRRCWCGRRGAADVPCRAAGDLGRGHGGEPAGGEGSGSARVARSAAGRGGVALAVGAVTGTVAGLLLVAVAFGAFQAATVLAEARLQHRIESTGGRR